MPPSVVGRDAELASLRDFVSSIPHGASALVLEGDAGAGKTTLWEAGLAEARAGGICVLAAQPAESETTLSFSAIGDLLDAVIDEALASLSPAQHRALSRALVIGEDEGPPPDPHAIGVAVLSSLRALHADRPVLVAIDDVQWLDPASGGALSYAVRRLRSERVGVLLAHRSALESTFLTELRRSLPADRVNHLDVGPLAAGELHRVVQAQLGVVLARPRLDEVLATSGGNPFYALEIVRSLQRSGGSVDVGQPLQVPESLHDLVHGRLLALPSESRDFLLAAAAHAHPTISVVEAASGIDRSAGLLPALEARVVEADGDRLRFTHPLLAAGAYATSEQARRREVHARLANLLDDPEARAWQLAASVDSADEDVAEALEKAAVHAQRRGALRPAALMLERASELTPSVRAEDAVRRAVDAAYLHFESGDSRHAETQLRTVIAPLEAGAQRARALAILARIRLYEAPSDAAGLFAQVVEESGGDLSTLAVAHEGIASCHIWRFEGFRELLRHSEIALALADELGDEALVADALMAHLSAEALLGLPSATATAERAVALQGSAADRRVLDQPLGSVVEYWTWVDSHDRAHTALLDLLQRARDLGDENAPPWLLCLLGDAERISGRLETALVCARDGREAAEQSGQHLFATRNLALESLVLAELGRPDLARDAARRVLDVNPDNFAFLVASTALGHLGLALGTPAETVAPLERCLAFVQLEEIVEPGAARFVIDLVEALLELGRSAEAVEVLDWYEHNARQLDRASALASSLRCRGLLAAQAGDLDSSFVAFDEALSTHVAAEIPLDRARTLLALGVSQRRARRRREARATLESALSVFASIGAALWVERARGELRRISGRAPAAGTLTPAEERVAELVAEGKTNREVAAALFLSDRTVEGHLSRIFRKLGVRHRAELGRIISARQSQGIAGSNTGESPVSTDSAPP